MNELDIMDAVQQSIDKVILNEWRHVGYIDGFTSDSITFVIDGSKYVLKLSEAKQ